MAFQISPGVNVTEKDVTLLVPAIATTPAGMVGLFQWGPGNEPVTITSEKELLQVFGKPARATVNSDSAILNRWWWSAANFLSYGNNLKLIRFINDNVSTQAKTATSGSAAVAGHQLCNLQSYRNLTLSDTYGFFAAKYPGDLGNSLKVVVLDATTSVDANTNGDGNQYFDFIANFDGLPGTSPWAKNLTGNDSLNDEIHVLVIDEDGAISGVAGTVLERFGFLSKARNAVNQNGTSNYYRDVINNTSQYIWALYHLDVAGVAINSGNIMTSISNDGATTVWGAEIVSTSPAFKVINNSYNGENLFVCSLYQGRMDTANPSDNDIAEAYSTYMGDPEIIDVSMFITGPMGKTAAYRVIEIAEARKDVVAFVSPQPLSGGSLNFNLAPSAYLETLKDFRDDGDSTSYGVADSGYKMQYDNYNDEYVYIPLNADIAGLCARTDTTTDPWFSPAGLNRGGINRVIKLPFNPNQGQRDDLYKIGINPVVSFPGIGPVLFGDKTLLSRPSAFDRINVRRLFIILEKSIATAAKFQLFEFNDEFTRAQFVNFVTPFLRNVLGRRGITDFRVVCDETNNTPQVIDSNNFVADIYIKPNKSINFIQLNFIATPSGLSFEEVVGA